MIGGRMRPGSEGDGLTRDEVTARLEALRDRLPSGPEPDDDHLPSRTVVVAADDDETRVDTLARLAALEIRLPGDAS